MTQAQRHHPLPPSLPPRGVRREEAAAYVGVSPRKFDEMVQDGRMPPAKRIDGRLVWDRRRLDEFFDALPDDGAGTVAGQNTDAWDFQA